MPNVLIRFPEMQRRNGGLSRTQVWRLEREGRYPRRVVLGDPDVEYPNKFGPPVAWIEAEVDAWVASRIRAGGKAHGRVRPQPTPSAKRHRKAPQTTKANGAPEQPSSALDAPSDAHTRKRVRVRASDFRDDAAE